MTKCKIGGKIMIKIFRIEKSLEKVKCINKLGRKNIWIKAKMFRNPQMDQKEILKYWNKKLVILG
jgi:hypothetical protein